MGSTCSDTSGDASHHAHPLSGLPREANSPRGECGYVGRRAGGDEARARTATGLRHRIKLVRVEILPEIIGPRVGCALPRASCEHACAACVSDERRSNALVGSMSPMRTWRGQPEFCWRCTRQARRQREPRHARGGVSDPPTLDTYLELTGQISGNSKLNQISTRQF